jgi:hypothetical protein
MENPSFINWSYLTSGCLYNPRATGSLPSRYYNPLGRYLFHWQHQGPGFELYRLQRRWA